MYQALSRHDDEEPPGRRSSSDSADSTEPPPNQFQTDRPTFSLPQRPVRRTSAFRRRFYPEANQADWDSWRWQIAHRIRTISELERFIKISDSEREAIVTAGERLPFAITPYYLSLVDPDDPGDPIRRTVIPTPSELEVTGGEAADPLNEDADSPVPGLVHRYPDRVLFLSTPVCSTYCRYCTRSRRVGDHDHGMPVEYERVFEYIAAHPEIRDVLLSGGDPLTMSDTAIARILSRLRRIPHVEIVRIGTKVPAVLPMRITPALTATLRRFHPLYVSIHATHPAELTKEMVGACERLADAGIPLGSQTVLLSGINDSVETMKALMHGLLRARVRPYYLYQCDPIQGSGHFRTPVSKGLEIIKGLRGHTSGYAVPTYVIDAPGGGGKIPLIPEYLMGRDDLGIALKNYEGNVYHYPDVSIPQGPGRRLVDILAATGAGTCE